VSILSISDRQIENMSQKIVIELQVNGGANAICTSEQKEKFDHERKKLKNALYYIGKLILK